MNPTETDFQELLRLTLAQAPEKADAIVWLQGDRLDRGPKTLELFQAGFAPVILLTGNNVLLGPDARLEEDNIGLLEMRSWLMERGVPADSILVDDRSMNTRDQAIKTLDLAAKNNWRVILLVGSGYYQPRAFLTFLNCAHAVSWPGRIVNQAATAPWDSIPSGRRKTAATCLEMEKMKIQNYTNDVASVRQGLEYLRR